MCRHPPATAATTRFPLSQTAAAVAAAVMAITMTMMRAVHSTVSACVWVVVVLAVVVVGEEGRGKSEHKKKIPRGGG